jgi:4-hydroxy-2-oxoheptanedioate aldolase
MKNNRVKEALAAGIPQVGTWLSLASPLAARFQARAGWHWLTVDMEHSAVDWETTALMFAAIADAGGTPLIRVPSIAHEHAKRALDQGAYGIVFPMCNSRQQAELAVAACKYPPEGNRSVGGSQHALNFDTDPATYYRNANQRTLVIVQIEHREGVERCEEILSVPGIDAVFVGPNDLLASMHKTPQMETDDPQFVAALQTIRTTALRHGVAPGIHVADANAALRRIAEGWRFIAISSELGMMQKEAAETIRQVCGAAMQSLVRY